VCLQCEKNLNLSMNQAEAAAKEREKGLSDEVETLTLRLSTMSADLEASRELASEHARGLDAARREAVEAGVTVS